MVEVVSLDSKSDARRDLESLYEHMEPEALAVLDSQFGFHEDGTPCTMAADLSKAVSLKRLADAMERIADAQETLAHIETKRNQT